MCPGLLINVPPMLCDVIPTINIPLILVYHFVGQGIHKPLWAKPFIADLDSNP
jgi:hypothetical protein